MSVPQIIHADQLTKDWPRVEIVDAAGRGWMLVRPYALGNVITRVRLAWGVFTGKYDALMWFKQ